MDSIVIKIGINLLGKSLFFVVKLDSIGVVFLFWIGMMLNMVELFKRINNIMVNILMLEN